jgi:hypothetical protein
MFTLDQSLIGTYHVASLRAEARRDADARALTPRKPHRFSRRAR